ncbi:MAG: RICIN domain-containing protein [Clostridia bacterium]|nr:RICIN domain-containing protein [Clostridia bacterium]
MKRNVTKIICFMIAVFMALQVAPVSVEAADYELAMFPMTYMNITQGVNGALSHVNTNALDIAGKDGGIDNLFAPFTCVVKRKYTDNAGGNVVWIQSQNRVYYADGSLDYMTILLVHDNDTSDLWVGKVIPQGTVFFQEGTSGAATGNHVHMEVGRGAFYGSGWHANPNPKMSWIVNGSMVPWDALFISPSTIILNGYGYNWRYSHRHSFDKKTFMCECGEFNPDSVTLTAYDGMFKIKSDDAIDHTGPYGACKSVTAYKKNDIVTATHKAVNGYGHTWYRLSNGRYIYEEYLKKYTINYADINAGDYNILNLSTMKYLIVDEGKNVDGQNVSVWDYSTATEEKWAVSKDSLGYIFTSKLGTRVLNPWVDNVVTPGSNITILTAGSGDKTQRWKLELVTGGYVIRSLTNLSCVLTVQNGKNVIVDTYRAGDRTQIWQFEPIYECSHNWNSSVITKQPSCSENGIRTYTCIRCNATKNELIPMNSSHSLDGGVTIKTGTCKTEGEILYSCTECDYTYVKYTGYGENHGNLKLSRSGEFLSVSKFTCNSCGAEYIYDLGVKSVTTSPINKNEISVKIVFEDNRNIRKSANLSFPATGVSELYPNGIMGVVNGTVKSQSISGNVFTAILSYTDGDLSQLVGDAHSVHMKFENKDDPTDKYGYVRVILNWKQGEYVNLKPGETCNVNEILGRNLEGFTLYKYNTDVVSYDNGIVTAKKGGSVSLVFCHNMTGETTGITVVVEEKKPEPVVNKGDVNGDGKVSSSDARLALRGSVGLDKLSASQEKCADIDGNSKVTSADARYILRYSVGLIDTIWQ